MRRTNAHIAVPKEGVTPAACGTTPCVAGMLQHDIAALFRINQGRVSEVINDKRFPDGLSAP